MKKTGRKAKNIIKKRFGSCVIQRKAGYLGNNLQYEALCDCGQTFLSSGQQFRSNLITSCPSCRKRKVRQMRDAARLQRLGNIDGKATKYTLMNPTKDRIIKGRSGIHAYFDKSKARIAARLSGAVVVPLSEAIILCRS